MPSERKRFAVIGDPIAHSLSPAMHNAAFRAAEKNAEYTAIHVLADDIEAFFAEAVKTLSGFNVTVPHKGAAMRLADRLSDTAALCGSVNTVKILPDGTTFGDTTDGAGFERAVAEAFDLSLAGADLCFIGCGGVVQALVWHCALAGVQSIRILNRSLEKAEALTDAVWRRFPQIVTACAALSDREKTAEFLAASDLAVQCTSVGLHEGDPVPVDPALFPERGICYFDTIYRRTALLDALDRRGIPVQDGLAMLLHQGAKSYEIWLDEPAPVEVMRQALTDAVKQR
ncbi:MAG: shikimate dehydrogenase [Lentisphaeria bacterium]|nr:shikimate dehydrogenase [Lentisphaeria bacterium]